MPRLLWCALAALLMLCACTSSQADTPPRAAKPTARNAEPSRAAAPVVFVLGDSYTAGIPEVPPEQTYAAETARKLGWQIVIAGHAGTGFLARGRVDKDFARLFNAELAWRPAPDMVVVSGGHNDHRHPAPRVAAAAERLLTQIKDRWPQSHLVLTGPLWGGDPPLRALRVRDVLRDTATNLGVPFVDPLAGRWITGDRDRMTGNAARFILPDGTHPTPAGNRYIADRLITDLRALGLDRPALGKPARRPSRKPSTIPTRGPEGLQRRP